MSLKEQILELHKQGYNYTEIQSKLKCSKGTISYHCNSKSKAKVQQTQKQLRKRNQTYIDNIKQKSFCQYCGCNNSKCLDFHHIDSSTKDDKISQLVANRVPISKIQDEIDKCIILCANCHRELHYKYIKHKSTIRTLIENIKKQSFCSICGHKGVASLSFHHTHDKKFDFGKLSHKEHGIDNLLIELEKCVLICENCHRLKH